MPSIIDGNASATFQTPLPLSQGGNGNTTGNVTSSQVADALNATGSAPLYACRAWVNFNGTGTVAIRASGNVSSITDNGVGNYTVNFATAMTDANYSFQANGNTSKTYNEEDTAPVRNTAAIKMCARESSNNAFVDTSQISAAIFR